MRVLVLGHRDVLDALGPRACADAMAAGADHGLAPERIAGQLRSSLDRLGVDHV